LITNCIKNGVKRDLDFPEELVTKNTIVLHGKGKVFERKIL
jgi:hypothetical protein